MEKFSRVLLYQNSQATSHRPSSFIISICESSILVKNIIEIWLRTVVTQNLYSFLHMRLIIRYNTTSHQNLADNYYHKCGSQKRIETISKNSQNNAKKKEKTLGFSNYFRYLLCALLYHRCISDVMDSQQGRCFALEKARLNKSMLVVFNHETHNRTSEKVYNIPLMSCSIYFNQLYWINVHVYPR